MVFEKGIEVFRMVIGITIRMVIIMMMILALMLISFEKLEETFKMILEAIIGIDNHFLIHFVKIEMKVEVRPPSTFLV